MKKRIENAIKTLGIENKTVYTMGEMNAICKEANCDLIHVMYYLRYDR